MMNKLWVMMKKEWSGYFQTPMAVVLAVAFVVLSMGLTFYVGQFYEREIADLRPFFQYHPWIYLFIGPAIGMRLWAEEYRSGSAELLLSLPMTASQVILGKFLAAWSFVGLCLLLTLPIWLTVNFLGAPDNGVIVASYIGSWLMAGGFLAVSQGMSATTQNPVIAFLLGWSSSFFLLLAGLPAVLDPLSQLSPQWFVDAVAQLSFLRHFSSIARGVVELGDVFYFFSLMAFGLTWNAIWLQLRREG